MEPSEKSRQTSRSQNSFALLTTSYFSTAASFVKDDFNLEQIVIPALRDRVAGHRSSGRERGEKARGIRSLAGRIPRVPRGTRNNQEAWHERKGPRRVTVAVGTTRNGESETVIFPHGAAIRHGEADKRLFSRLYAHYQLTPSPLAFVL